MKRRIAWVTGASHGIGRAIALRLGRDGLAVAVGYHKGEDAAEEVVAEITSAGGKALAVGGDLGTEKGVEGAHKKVVEGLGPVSVLVANHGAYRRTTFDELGLDEWQRGLSINLTGPFLLTRRVLPTMREQGWGRLVYTGSIRGRTGSSHGAHYAAAKAALVGLARSVANEAGADAVTANVVAPGMIDTRVLAGWDEEKREARANDVPLKRLGRPEDVAGVVAWLASEDASYVSGAVVPVDGAWSG
ncbi:MAG: 3-oxoacyl-ACP reductase FabG [Euryarchaeota archaeon]|nr:3-oxoacyl-ACP reductase FabG [Euryarchaeota archaeon]